jgi:hypothetical protein
VFPRELEGQRFEDVVQQVREIAGPIQPVELTASQRSDRFFHAIGFERFEPHLGARYYRSLRDITRARAVDLIVRGTFVDVRIESVCFDHAELGCYRRPSMTFVVEEVLDGTPTWSAGDRIEVKGRCLARDVDPDRLPALVLDHEVLLFLGEIRDPRPPGSPHYYPIDFQAILRGLRGRVRTIDPSESADPTSFGSYPTALEGDPFEDVVDRVRDLVGERR